MLPLIFGRNAFLCSDSNLIEAVENPSGYCQAQGKSMCDICRMHVSQKIATIHTYIYAQTCMHTACMHTQSHTHAHIYKYACMHA